jgi:hypothetical protein
VFTIRPLPCLNETLGVNGVFVCDVAGKLVSGITLTGNGADVEAVLQQMHYYRMKWMDCSDP